MSGSAGSGWWRWGLGLGFALVVLAFAGEHYGWFATWLEATLLALGGLASIAAACEAMILCVDALARRMRWNEYVAGVLASLASNLPEVAMIGFVVAHSARVAFVVVLLTLHINALVFAGFCILLPRDRRGQAHLPRAMEMLGTDMLAGAAGLLAALGFLMVTMNAFGAGRHAGQGLGIGDLIALGVVLLAILAVYVVTLVRRFAVSESEASGEQAPASAESTTSWGAIVGYGALGSLGSLVGGHAVGEFADLIVNALRSAGYSEMIGAIVVSFLAGMSSYILATSAHVRGKTELALSNVFGGIVQAPFVILPAALLFAALFGALGVLPRLPHGGILTIDLETVSVVLFAFPSLMVLWKAIGDDGSVNRLETGIMLGLFALVLYFLAVHG